jgi:hypothetical protein
MAFAQAIEMLFFSRPPKNAKKSQQMIARNSFPGYD